MELVSFNKTSFRLVIICFLILHFRVTRAKKHETARSDLDREIPEVTINQGTVRGVTLSTRKNKIIAGYLGIPYAQPPIGNLRFKAPVPAEPWSKTLYAGKDTPDCPQILNSEVIGNEDCLYLNVYTPRVFNTRIPPRENSELLPVMVYIHGGAFHTGSNNYTALGPEYLLDEDMLLVVVSYRLGALGFLSTGDEESLGNWGLKDQVLALEWVRDNIECFGGDPNEVTLSGQSSGSSSVDILALSCSTMGLFHRYIVQSGSGSSIIAYKDSAEVAAKAVKLGEYLGCPTDTSAALIKCLRKLEFTKIVDTVSLFTKWGPYPLVVWEPTIEPDVSGALLTESPLDLVANGKIRNIPWMVGSIPGDGLVFTGYLYANPDKYEEFLDKFDEILPCILNYNDKVKDVSAYTKALKSYYFNNNLTSDRNVILSNLTELITDVLAKFPNYQVLQQAAKCNPTYLYSFEYRGTFSKSYKYIDGSLADYGPAHGDELLYLFPRPATISGEFNATLSESDSEMIDGMVQLWTSFVITGDPTSITLKRVQPWPRYSVNMEHFRIGSGPNVSFRIEVEGLRFKKRLKFFENLTEAFMFK